MWAGEWDTSGECVRCGRDSVVKLVKNDGEAVAYCYLCDVCFNTVYAAVKSQRDYEIEDI